VKISMLSGRKKGGSTKIRDVSGWAGKNQYGAVWRCTEKERLERERSLDPLREGQRILKESRSVKEGGRHERKKER